MAHNEPSHLDLCCLTFNLSTLHINFPCDYLLRKKKKKRRHVVWNFVPKELIKQVHITTACWRRWVANSVVPAYTCPKINKIHFTDLVSLKLLPEWQAIQTLNRAALSGVWFRKAFQFSLSTRRAPMISLRLFLYYDLFSTALCELAKVILVQSLMLYSHHLFWLSPLIISLVPCRVFAMPEEREWWRERTTWVLDHGKEVIMRTNGNSD